MSKEQYLDLLATMQGDETPLLNQMLAYNEQQKGERNGTIQLQVG